MSCKVEFNTYALFEIHRRNCCLLDVFTFYAIVMSCIVFVLVETIRWPVAMFNNNLPSILWLDAFKRICCK